MYMKRAVIYLVGVATLIALITTVRSAWLTSSSLGSWDPDDSGYQGYLVELYPDSLITALAPGHPLRLITPEALLSHIKQSDTTDSEVPILRSGSDLADAAWLLSVDRLRSLAPTPYNIIASPMLCLSGRSPVKVAWKLLEGPGCLVWPLADADRLMRIIALARLSLLDESGQVARRAAPLASEWLRADSLRLYRTDCGLWVGGGDGLLSGPLPKWASETDRFNVASLSINALATEAYASLALMLRLSDKDDARATEKSIALGRAINDRLWMPSLGYYSQYLYGRYTRMRSPAASGLGNALAAVSPNIATPEMARRVVASLPRTPYGILLSAPHTPGASAEPEIMMGQGLWAEACRRASDDDALWSALAVLLRSVGLTAIGDMTNVPEVWGAYAGAITGIVFGLEPTEHGLLVHPLVPTELSGEKSLTGLPYRNAILDITLVGTGSTVAEIQLDGRELRGATLPLNLSGRHTLYIEMQETSVADDGRKNLNASIPTALEATPEAVWISPNEAVDSTTVYSTAAGLARFVNGVRLEDISLDEETVSFPECSGFAELLFMPVDRFGAPSGLMADPHYIMPRNVAVLIQAEWFKGRELARDIYRRMLRHWRKLKQQGRVDDSSRPNPRLTQIVELKSDETLTFTAEAPMPTDCVAIIGYAEGRDAGTRGPRLRTMSVNGRPVATLSMPSTGVPADTTVTLSSHPVRIRLEQGVNEITLSSTEADRNPSRRSDTVMIDYLRLIPLASDR